ncbi:cellulase family glycosylhydrolase [Aeromicrobium sp. NPDC092404]|uniref:cellulase family glycosylhydrolase n=1 Tax=Aeromicrobium sp. NPDC092404 TaxID=3154976 RepID=UPI003447CC29
MTKSSRAVRFIAVPALLVAAALVHTSGAAQAAPPAPTITYLEVAADSTTLRLSWPHVGGTLKEYVVHYRALGSVTWRQSTAAGVGSTYASKVPYVRGRTTYTKSFRAAGIVPGQAYEVTVRAVPTSGLASSANLSKVAVRTNPQLGALTTSATPDGDLTVTWPAYAATPFHQYDLYLREGSGTPSWRTYRTDIATTSHTFTGLRPGAAYTVGARVTQSQARRNGQPIKWVRSEMRTATQSIPMPATPTVPSNELFRSGAPSSFVSTATGEPFVANGVKIKRTAHKKSGVWETPYVVEEVAAMGRAGAPAFNTVRLAMDWSYFQRQVGSSIVIDTDAFAQLDRIIDEAIAQDLYVILDPMHLSNVATASNPSSAMCREDPAMAGAHKGIPAWAWTKVGAVPGTTCASSTAWDALADDALGLQETADYLRYVLERYDGSTARGQQVIAVDLVNEPAADGVTAVDRTQKLVDTVYAPWLAPTGSKSLRAVDPDKILIVTPVAGSGSLVGVDLAKVAQPNVVMTFHDYFGQATGTNATHGIGYSSSGYATQKEDTDQTGNTAMGGSYVPYSSTSKAYATRKAEHTAFVQHAVDVAAAAGMPLYVGEYGVVNPCNGGALAHSTAYAQDTYDIYEALGLSRAVWTHGYWDDMSIWWRESTPCGSVAPKTYFPYAADLTGGAVR